jgi:hypothetical protein
MAVEKHRLHPREKGVAPVQMAPASLDHPHFRIREKVDRLLEEIRIRNKIRVQDADKFALR